MKTDAELKRDVEAKVAQEWKVDIQNVRVIVNAGVVILTGIVRYSQAKWELQEAAQHVSGVRAVINQIKVKLFGNLPPSDEEIARNAANVIEWNASYQEVQAVVEDGCVTLTGTVHRQFQKQEVEEAIRRLHGVKGTTNKIVVKPAVAEAAVELMIETALERHASLDAEAIRVKTDGTAVMLEGTVHASTEKQMAEDAAWATPGVTSVDNKLAVAYSR
jgi:osmotically-inducible protein OsmY